MIHDIKRDYFTLELNKYRLTFDDGLFSHYYYYPLFSQHPSELIYFIATSFIKSGNLKDNKDAKIKTNKGWKLSKELTSEIEARLIAIYEKKIPNNPIISPDTIKDILFLFNPRAIFNVFLLYDGILNKNKAPIA